jgi:formiminotetrahydrofolate cyclodeaminase
MRKYLDALASNAPAPGGGSVAALVGTLAAALNSMVANFTVGKEKYRDVEREVRELLNCSEELREELSALMQADTEAYGEVSQAYGMARGTDQEREARTAAIQKALKSASAVPMRAAECSLEVIRQAAVLLEKGNVNLLSDVGVAARLGEAALQCAALNVEINLRGIKDEEFNAERRALLGPMLKEGASLANAIWGKVQERM